MSLDAFGVAVEDLEPRTRFLPPSASRVPRGPRRVTAHAEVELAGGLRLMFDTAELIRGIDPVVDGADRQRPRQFRLRLRQPGRGRREVRRARRGGRRGHKEPWDAFWGHALRGPARSRRQRVPLRRVATRRRHEPLDVLVVRPVAARGADPAGSRHLAYDDALLECGRDDLRRTPSGTKVTSVDCPGAVTTRARPSRARPAPRGHLPRPGETPLRRLVDRRNESRERSASAASPSRSAPLPPAGEAAVGLVLCWAKYDGAATRSRSGSAT